MNPLDWIRPKYDGTYRIPVYSNDRTEVVSAFITIKRSFRRWRWDTKERTYFKDTFHILPGSQVKNDPIFNRAFSKLRSH